MVMILDTTFENWYERYVLKKNIFFLTISKTISLQISKYLNEHFPNLSSPATDLNVRSNILINNFENQPTV